MRTYAESYAIFSSAGQYIALIPSLKLLLYFPSDFIKDIFAGGVTQGSYFSSMAIFSIYTSSRGWLYSPMAFRVTGVSEIICTTSIPSVTWPKTV